jgi:hypothetical protein
MLKTFIGTYIPDFNSIPSAVPEKKFLENRPIRIFSHMVAMFFDESAQQHFHLLLENSRTEFNQTWQRCFL